jgi:DNA-binding CsgD family transcriptional regulator
MPELSEESRGIVGRDRERRAVARLLEAIPSGLVALVVEGDPGIGKSTVLRDGVGQARTAGCRVLACQPAAAEARLSFAALGDLLEPVIDDVLSELPRPQRQALEVALLRAGLADAARDERGVSVAFLNAVRFLCAESAVLLAVDDAQWLDRPTARVVEFAIRRLGDSPVGVLASVRLDPRERLMIDLDRAIDPNRRERLCLGPLSLAATHQLLRARETWVLPRRVLLRVHELSGGNPFFALELTRALAARDQPLAPGEPLPVPGTLRELVAGRLARLPAPTREALLVAAALAQPTVGLIEAFDPRRRAAEVLAKAERRGLVETGEGRVRFSHPLVASTVYGGASAFDRRRVHRRLGEIVSDPEQRARHLALAANGPDASVAAALEEAADIADARGAPDAAAELCELARDLTPSDLAAAARRRNLTAAGHHFAAGDWERARALSEAVIAGGAFGPELARALHLLANVHYHGESFPEAARLLRAALKHADSDPAITAPIEVDLTYVIHTFEGFPAAAEHARAAVEHARVLDQPGLLAEALATVTMADFLAGRGLDRPRLERSLELEDRTRRVPVNVRPSLIAGFILAWIGESAAGCALLDDLCAWLIERGEETQLPMIGPMVVLADCWHGNLQAAASRARGVFDAATQLDSATSRAHALCDLAIANAYLGNVDDARRQAREAVELFRGIGFHVHTVFPLTALGFLHLSLDEPAETDRALRPMVALMDHAGLGEPSSAPFVPDEIEALIAVGELPLAASLLDTLETRAGALDRAVSLAPAARCRGLLLAAQGDHEAALAAFARALEQHQRAHRPVELARTLLALGQVQRRANHRRAARETLERALALFEELGAAQWARRTRGELARLGLRRRAGDELTPTEEQVAEHAACGMTNRQIASALFISPKTVEANLARAYRKLGISSRAELGRLIAERDRPTATKK